MCFPHCGCKIFMEFPEWFYFQSSTFTFSRFSEISPSLTEPPCQTRFFGETFAAAYECSFLAVEFGPPWRKKGWIRFHPPFTVPSVMFVSLHKNCWVKLDLLSPSEDGKLPRQAGAQQPGRLIDQVLKQVPGKDCSQTFFSHRLQRERLITGYSSR